jgi:histidinol-phosphate aminotransferase
MNFDINTIVRPHILALVPYSSAKDEYEGNEGVFLDANENPYESVNGQHWNRYPDPYQWEIKKKLAAIKNLLPQQIFLGNGSDEPIDLLMRAVCEPRHDSVLIMPPTYGMYEVSAAVNDVPLIKIPLTADYQIDTKKALAAIEPHTKIIWICSPNNPTGNLLQRESIIELLENFNGIVVVDEAYIDFADAESFVNVLNNYPNLVVLQTLSKAWGLASLRVGMAFASEQIIKILNKIKPPYNINGATQAIVTDALDYEKHKNKIVELIVSSRKLLAKDLSELSMVQKIYPSDTNYLLVQFTDAEKIMKYLIENKIIVRDRSKVKRCDNCLRITVGSAQENITLLGALKHYETINT